MSRPLALYLPGLALVLCGILILVFPLLLQILVAGLLLALGAMLLLFAEFSRRAAARGAGGMSAQQIFTVFQSRGFPGGGGGAPGGGWQDPNLPPR